MAEVKYIELEGNPTFTDRKLVAKIEKNFLRAVKKNPGLTWVLREQGFGKEGQNQWSQGRKDVYVLGATKTKEDYWKRKALGKKKGGLPKYDPQKAVPRTTAAATFYHAGKRENQRIIREIKASDLSEEQKKAEWQKRQIKFRVERVQNADIKYFQEQGAGKKAFALAAEQRDKRIEKIAGAGVRITESGEFEGKSEREARLMFEGIQELRKTAKPTYLERVAKYGLAEDGQAKLVPSNIKVTDEFIDEVNTRKFGTVKQERAFKAGALKFLQNKEAYQQITTEESTIFTPQRIEDTRSWHPGSSIEAFDSEIPQYIPGEGIETKFVGSTLITALPRGGPETAETVTLADPSDVQDYGSFIDDEIFDSRSSFVNMLPDETVPGQEFNYDIDEAPVPVQISTSAEELQASDEPTIRQTLVNRTTGEVTLIHDDPASGKWSDKAHARVGEQIIETPTGITSTYRVPNRIYYSQHVDTGLTAADLKLKATDPVQYAKIRAGSGVKPPDMSTMITASMGRTVDMGVPVTGSKGTDAVQSYLQGDAFTEEGDVTDAGNIKPTIKKGAPGLLESYREGTDFIEIEAAAASGFKGKKSGITSANPAQFSGQSSLLTSTPSSEVGTAMPGTKGGRPMTPEEIIRQQSIDKATAAGQGVGLKPIVTRKEVGGGFDVKIETEPELPMSERESLRRFAKFVTKKTAEYNARVAAGTQEDFIQGLQDKKSGIRVISGGQIGADLIGLEEAKKLGFKTGGTAPKGFQTSTGPNLNLSKTFNLTEISDQSISQYTGNEKFYGPRTEQNVLKSDVTFLFTNPETRNSPGSTLTRKLAKQHGRPLLENPTPKQVQSFIAKKGPNATINIAGNREFKNKGAIRNALAALSPEADAAIRIAESEAAFGPRGKPTTSRVADDVGTWQDVEPVPKPAVVSPPKTAITSGKPPNLTEYDLAKTVRDGMGGRPSATPENPKFPARPWYTGKSAAEMGLPVDKDGHLIKIKRPETAKPQADIELKKSVILTKETGKPTFTTKGEKVKTAVKTGAKLLKKPGSTTFNALGAITLMSPLIGAYGSLKKTNIEEAESKSAYPLYPVTPREITAKDYKQSLWHRLAPEVFRSVKEERKYKKSLISGDI